jgi:putative inorganic carbon (HCO3(-)) transporter
MYTDLSLRYPILRGKNVLLLIAVLVIASVLGVVTPQAPVLAVSAMIALLIGLAIIAKPDVATLVVLFVLYTNAAVVATRFHNVPSLIASALPALLLIPLTSILIFRREKVVITPVLPLIFLMLAVQVAGTLMSVNIAAATTNLINFFIEGLGLYFLITNTVRTRETLRYALWTLLIAGIFMGSLSLIQEVTGDYDNNYGGFAQMSNAAFGTGEDSIFGGERQRRLAGPVGEQNRYAQVMLMLVPIALFQVFSERKTAWKGLALLAALFAAIGVSLTFSRGAAVGFALVLIVMTLMRYIKVWQLGVVILAIAMLFTAVPEYRHRLGSLEGAFTLFSDEARTNPDEDQVAADGSMQSRYTEVMAAVLVFLDHPVVGVGPGMFRYYYQEYASYVGLRVHNANRQAHSLFPGLAAETGLLGLVLFCLILYITLRDLHRVRRKWRYRDPMIANMATGLMLAVVSYLTTGIFLHFAFIRYFWLVLALASAAVYIARHLEDEPGQAPIAIAPRDPNHA